MKKRVLSLFMVLVLCLTLLPTAAFAEGEDVSISGGVIGGGETGGGETGGEGGGIYVAPGSPTEGGGGTYIPGEDTRTEIWCVSKPDSIGRGYDGTTDGGTIPIDLTFTDGTNEIKLEEGTGFTAKKTFDSADAGWHTVTVEIALIGEAAVKYKLKAGEEKFEIGGNINKAYPDLTVSLSKTACTVGEKLLPLLSVEGAPQDAEVTYYYLASAFKSWAGSSDVEGSEAMPKINENTAISEPGTYYVYAKSGETKNYEEERSTTVELTVNEAVVEAASITKADGMDGGTYESLPAALNAAQDGDTVKLLADHVTDADALNALGEDFTFEQYASIVPVVTKTLTLDLNHKTVDYLEVGFSETNEETQKKETLATGNLTVTGEGAYGRISNLMFMAGALDIRSGEIGGSEGAGLVCDVNSGTATISNGTVYGLTVSEGASVTVNGGSNHAGEWVVASGATLNITDGTFGDVQFTRNGTIAISGGTFGTITNINGSSSIPLMPLLADNYAFYQGDNAQNSTEKTLTNVTVRPHTHSFENGKCACGVAAIVVDSNNSCYNTLQAALNAAADDASITSVTLGQDLTEDVMFSGSAAGSLTLNMNGHKLEAEAGVPLTVTGGTLRIEGAGEINQNTASNATAFPAIKLTGGKLVITGDLTAQGGYDSSGRKPAIYATDGELDLQGNVSLNGGLTITGTAKLTNPLTQGTFYVDASETGNAIAITDSEVPGGEVYKKALELLAKDYAFYRANGSLADAGGAKLRTGTYTIKSHTCSYTHDETYGIAYCNCGRSHAHRDLSDEKSVLVNGVCPICGYHCPHNTVDETTLSCSNCGAKVVAKVEVEGSEPTYAFDLASAFQNAVNGTTIKLLANEMLPSDTYVSKTLTLDLNGHSLDGYSLNVGGLTATSQVRTGNLTVIDSSGGNGAVGVTVREGGTLVFDPKNDHTTLLQLEVWGGTVELYGGKISRSGLRLNNNITLGDLLPQKAGLAYYRDDTQLTLEAAASQTCDLVVKSCSHGGKNGFDNNSTACPYCGAPAVAETALYNGEGNRPWRRFADLQTALDADRDGGATLKLLADVTGNYTIDGTQDTGLDLNDHSIKGTVTVKTAAGSNTTTLSNTKNTTTASIDNVVAYKGAKLAGSGKPAVIGTLTLAEGATWKNILNDTALGYKVLNADGTHKWYARDDVKDSQLNNVIINRLPITTKILNLKVDGKNLTKVERGTTVQLCASCNAKDVTVTFSILKTGETTPITLSGNDVQYTTVGTGTTKFYVAEYAFNDVGSYTISFTATKDGYSVTSSHKKLTVTKPNLSNAEITFPYGNEAAFNSVSATGVPMFVVTYNGTKLEENVDFVITRGASTYDVGPCTLTIKATDNGDYTGSKSAEWTVRPLKVAASVGDIIKTYDGTTDLPANAKITFKSADSYYTGTTLRLAKGTDYEVSNAHYDSADASETEKTVSFTIKLKNAGYVFEDGTTQKDFTLKGSETDKTFKINKATAPMNNPIGTLNIINGTCQTYTYDFNNILPGLPGGKYGTISYGKADISLVSQSGYYYDETIVEFKKGVLTLAQFYAKDGKMTGKIGTVKVNVTTTNYENFQLKLVLYAVDQIKPEPDGTITASEITYGDTLSKSEISGKMKDPNTGDAVNGTFAWTDGTIKPDANDRYEAEWTFTPAEGYEEYATATGTVTVKVKPAKLIVSVKASSMYYTGEEQIASIIASGQSVDSTPVTFTYSDKVDGNYTSGGPTFTDAGTYTAYYKAEAANHEPATGTFTVTIDPLPISLLSVSSISKTYDGSADVTLTADKLTFFSKTANAKNIKLPDTALTFSDAQFTSKQEDGSYLPSPEVGNGKALSFTMTLTSNNYVFEGKSEGTTEVSDVFATDDVNRFTITKAAAPGSGLHPAVTVINDLAKTYEMVLSNDYLPKLSSPCEYGNVSYSLRGTYLTDGYKDTVQAEVVEENGQYKLKLTVPAVDYNKVSSVGTIDVRVTSDNYRDFYLTIGVKTKNKDVPVPDGPISASDITYGQALNDSKIAGKMKAGGKAIDGTFTWTDGTIKPDANDNYEAEWTFTPAEGYEKYATATGKATVKVAPKSIEGATITLKKREFTYNAAEQSPTITGVTLKGWSETITTYDIASGDKAINANDSITLTIKGTGNYTGTATAEWKIIPAKLTVSVPSEVKKEYDGTTNATVTPTFNGLRGKDNLTAADYSVTAAFDNAKVGYKKTVIGKVTLNQTETAKNYVLTNDGNFSTDDGTITKAVAPTVQPVELTIYNGVQADYYVDLPSLPDMGKGKSYGTVGYRKTHTINLSEGYKAQSDLRADPENLNTLRLLLHMTQTGSLTGEIGTVTIPVTTSNYQDITLTVKISAKNRITPTGTPTLSKNAIIYGDALNTIALSGKLHDNVNNVDVDGTFEWVDGTHIPVVGNGTYAAEWIFEPTDTEKYLTVSGRSNITVEKARQYGKLSMAGYTYGKTPSTPTLTDQTGDLNAQVTYSYAAADSGSVQTWDISNPPALNAGTYRMYASIGDTDNYYGFEAVYCEFVVAKATPTYTVPTGLTAKYGQTLADVTLPDGWSWMDSSESVGGASTAAKTFQAKFTPKDTENYNTVENIELEVTVNKADGGNLKTVELEQKYTDASDHTYTPDWAGLPAGQDWTFSSEASIVLPKQDFAADGNLLTYAISGGKAGDKITLILKASCDNYEDFTITLNVTLTEKDDQKPLTITGNTSVIYGEKLTLTTTGGSGMGTVTYRIDTDASTGEATIDPNTGVLTPVKVGSVSVIATKAGDNNYNDVTSAPFVLMIKPATPTGEPNYTIKATAGAGGSISPSGNVSVREGGDQTFTITPGKGYAVANVKIDGKSIGAVKSYTFENVSSPHTIEAIFVKGTASASTGDSSNLPLWSALLLASTLALAGAVHLKRKRAR